MAAGDPSGLVRGLECLIVPSPARQFLQFGRKPIRRVEPQFLKLHVGRRVVVTMRLQAVNERRMLGQGQQKSLVNQAHLLSLPIPALQGLAQIYRANNSFH